MKSESLKGKNFIIHICKDRLINGMTNPSYNEDRPYQMVLSSEYVWPNFSKEELKDVADFINEFVEKN
jgi:hypothetical protein